MIVYKMENVNIYDQATIHPARASADFFYVKKDQNKKCRIGVLKCCGIIALTLGLNAFSFYVGYRVASNDSSESL